MPFHLDVCNAFNDGGSGVVDAVEHRLSAVFSLSSVGSRGMLSDLELYHRGNMKKTVRALQRNYLLIACAS